MQCTVRERICSQQPRHHDRNRGLVGGIAFTNKKGSREGTRVGLDCEASRVTLSDPLIPVRLYFLKVLQPSQTMPAG